MKAVLIFDNVNDLLFSKWDEEFLLRMKSFGGQEKDGNITDSYHISQLLSPIITSQRIMAAQFSNTYTSMQCKDDTTIVFDEWLDHVLMIISEYDIDDAHRELMDCKTLVQHICGQNINLLHSSVYQDWLSVLLESRTKGDSIPGASGVIGENGATLAALNALKSFSKEIKCGPYQHYHLMLFVGDKMLALYSTRGCEDLMPPDLILLSIQCVAAQEYWSELRCIEDDQASNDVRLPWLSAENSAIVNLCAGSPGGPCAPHSLHLVELAPRVVFAVLVDMELRETGISAHLSSQILCNLRRLLLQRNMEMVPTTLDSLEQAIKKTTDALRKNKANGGLCARLTSRLLELRKAAAGGASPLSPDTAAAALHTALDALLEQLKPDIPSPKINVTELKTQMSPYMEFLKQKAERYFNLESGETDMGSSISLHKYVEEFPGLIHFVYVDRTTGRFLAPDMADCVDMLTPATVRAVIRRALAALRGGCGAAAWRRGALHVCALQWWERRGAPARPAHAPAAARALPTPGDIRGSFYRQLQELAFPGDSQGVSLKELICIHLGLLPASTAVQQARRLAHSVYELAGENPAVANDLL